jgi:hypothetical protein
MPTRSAVPIDPRQLIAVVIALLLPLLPVLPLARAAEGEFAGYREAAILRNRGVKAKAFKSVKG